MRKLSSPLIPAVILCQALLTKLCIISSVSILGCCKCTVVLCRQVGEAEHLTAAQNLEVQQFLDGVVQTQCMQYVHQILIQQVCHQLLLRRFTCTARRVAASSSHILTDPAASAPTMTAHIGMCSNLQTVMSAPSSNSCIRCGSALTRVKYGTTPQGLSMCLWERPEMAKFSACTTGSSSATRSDRANLTTRATSSLVFTGMLAARHGCCEPVALQKPCLVTMSHLVTLPVLLFYVCRNLPAYAHDISRSSSLLCDPDLMPGAVALNMLAAMYLYRPLAERCGVYSLGGQQEEVDANERMLSVQFTWNGQLKDVSSMFIGTSPEFELALYTLCFLAGQEENIVQVGDYEVKIKVYRIKSKYGDKVGSAYPEVSHPTCSWCCSANLHDCKCIVQMLYWCVTQQTNGSLTPYPPPYPYILEGKHLAAQQSRGRSDIFCVLHAANSEAVRTGWRHYACASTTATAGSMAQPRPAIKCSVSTSWC